MRAVENANRNAGVSRPSEVKEAMALCRAFRGGNEKARVHLADRRRYAQIEPQRGLGNQLGVVAVVLLSFYQRLHIDRGIGPRLVTQLATTPG